jgi:hypothetical protein
MVYPDLESLLALLTEGEHSVEAAALLRQAALPFGISIVHRLQVENALLRFLYDPQAENRHAAQQGLFMWQHYLREGVIEFQEIDLSSAFAQASAWNAEYQIQPPRWHTLIHVGIAATLGATLMSFEPALRKRASDSGLNLLPFSL